MGCCGALLLAAAGACHRPPAQEVPRQYESITIGYPEGTGTPDGQGAQQLVETLSAEGLVQIGDDGRVQPRIAEKWRWEDGDGVPLLHITLKQNVYLHDGRPLTAPLAAEILRAALADDQSSRYPSLIDVLEVNAEGERDLMLKVSAPSPLLLEDLEIPLRTKVEKPARPASTGPFRVVSESTDETVLERFERYYQGPPTVARVVVRPFDRLRTAWPRLMRGDVDMVTDVPPDSVNFMKYDHVQVVSVPRRRVFVVGFNSRKPMFASARTRRALNLAIDRGVLMEKALMGFGVPAVSPIWPKHWAYDAAGAADAALDRRLAAELLDQQGLKVRPSRTPDEPSARFRFVCLVPEGFSVVERLGLEVQRQLYEIDVDMQFEVVPRSEFGGRIETGDFDAVLIDLSSGPGLGRPFIFWRSRTLVDTGYNRFGYDNRQVEAAYQALRNADSEEAVRSSTRRLVQLFVEDPPAIFLAWSERTRALRREYKLPEGPELDPVASLWRLGADTQTGGTNQ